jgi:nitronate monooxygenase
VFSSNGGASSDDKDTAMPAMPWSSSLNLRAPLINAPMGGIAGGRLALAISGAGGHAMISIGTAGSVELIERESAIPRQARQPFGIGLLGWPSIKSRYY